MGSVLIYLDAAELNSRNILFWRVDGRYDSAMGLERTVNPRGILPKMLYAINLRLISVSRI